MKISFDTLAILVTAGQGRNYTKPELARAVNSVFASPRTDTLTVTAEVTALEQMGLLRAGSDKKLALTAAGWAEILVMIPAVEQLRALLGGARVPR